MHVVNRGADRQETFSTDRHRFLFEDLMGEAFVRFGVELHAYALMNNHFHLLAHQPDGGLSDAMHLLCSRYVIEYNRATRRDGPLFKSRFHAVAIATDAQLTQTGRYIHRNPLAFVPPSALVAYRWSSLGALCGRRPRPDWLATGTLVSDGRADSYLEYVLAPQPSDRLEFNGLRPLRRTSCDDIDAATRCVCGIAPIQALTGAPRAIAIVLALEMRSATIDELAERHGLSDPGSVRRIERQSRVRLLEPGPFADLRLDVIRRLDGGR